MAREAWKFAWPDENGHESLATLSLAFFVSPPLRSFVSRPVPFHSSSLPTTDHHTIRRDDWRWRARNISFHDVKDMKVSEKYSFDYVTNKTKKRKNSLINFEVYFWRILMKDSSPNLRLIIVTHLMKIYNAKSALISCYIFFCIIMP